MGLFEKLFNKTRDENIKNKSNTFSPEYEKLLMLKDYMDSFLCADRYIARSEVRDFIKKYESVLENFNVIIANDLMDDFCKKNGASASLIEETIQNYKDIYPLIEIHNEEYIQRKMIEEKDYLDSILADVDPQIKLDKEQRKVVLTDEDYCLVIAGAGAGKTTTVAAKVKYLVERGHVDPKQILVISFTNKAVKELKDRINRDLNLDCPIATFHSTGNAILHKGNQVPQNIVEPYRLYYCTQEYFTKVILNNPPMVDNLIRFFASYFDAPYEGNDLNEFFNKVSVGNYTTLKSELDEICVRIIDRKTKNQITIQNEYVRSEQEVEIANFLYLNNIEYSYEPVYPYNIEEASKPYTPDFLLKQENKEVYLEHFGISESGQNRLYSEDELKEYKKRINDKILLHRQHGTNLMYTFSEYNDNRHLLEHLKELLELNGFELKPKSSKEVFEKIIASEESRYVRRLVDLVCRFINNFKTNGYDVSEFERMKNSTDNVRNKLFLTLCRECFLYYEQWLSQNDAIDFQDMINESARLINEAKIKNEQLNFKYIIVDEYQDISRQRFDLTKALSDLTGAKIIAVGDDWQSIYAFSGSDITLFTKFSEIMGYAKQMKIVNTYRNSQEVIDIAGNFIQKNTNQICKTLISPKNIEDPVIIYTYDGTRKRIGDDNRSGANYAMASAVESALDQIIEYNKKEGKGKDSSILLLGRFGFDGDRLEKSGLFEFTKRGGLLKSVKYPNLKITFMTAHASKGLGYDNVIIVNGRNETYGFPAKIEDDPVLQFVVKKDRTYEYAEERRLFYVAMTRTKNRVFVVAPENNPSEFLLEIKHDYKNVVLKGKWNENEPFVLGKKKCPLCGFPLQLRYKKSYGLKLYICSNEPELCGFMTNNINGGKLSIQKCNQCRDGYLIVKKAKDTDYFLGCTNYNKNGTGCSKAIWKNDFYRKMNYTLETTIDTGTKRNDENAYTKKPPHYADIEKKQVEYNAQMKRADEIIFIALNCLNHVSESQYFGITVLVDVLHGGNTEKIRKYELNNIKEYGAFKQYKKSDIEYIIRWLIANKYILQTKGKYPVLHPTYEGMHYDEYISSQVLEKFANDMEERVKIRPSQ